MKSSRPVPIIAQKFSEVFVGLLTSHYCIGTTARSGMRSIPHLSCLGRIGFCRPCRLLSAHLFGDSFLWFFEIIVPQFGRKIVENSISQNTLNFVDSVIGENLNSKRNIWYLLPSCVGKLKAEYFAQTFTNQAEESNTNNLHTGCENMKNTAICFEFLSI